MAQARIARHSRGGLRGARRRGVGVGRGCPPPHCVPLPTWGGVWGVPVPPQKILGVFRLKWLTFVQIPLYILREMLGYLLLGS